ncbi:MAG: hypothetical protein HQK60_17955 [Deltaproteobacteria bacterium]|nr:hypothetical protein [Deltaproteobacteria bacterium]
MRTKTRAILTVMVILMMTVSTLSICAAQDKPATSVSAGFFSKYIWRGYELSKDSLVIQPDVNVGYKGFKMDVWGNLDTKHFDPASDDKNSRWTETDLTLTYDYDLGPVTVGAGYIYYALATSTFDSQELFLKAAGNCLLTPTLTIYREFAHYPGWYFKLGVNHSIPVVDKITVDLAASVGYLKSDTDKTVEYDDSLKPTTSNFNAFHDGLVTVGMTIPFCTYFTASPQIGYSFPLTNTAKNEIRATSFSDDSQFFFGGVTLGMAF